MAATRSRISVEEYLALPHDEPPWLEYYRGEVIEKPLPNADHSQITGRLAALLFAHARAHGGKFGVEGRVRFDDDLEGPSFLLPDIAYYRPGTPFKDGQMLQPPTLSIEVRSPGQTNRYYEDRADHFLGHGVEEVWVIQPESRSILRYRAGVSVDVVSSGALASIVAPNFVVDLAEIFADLDDDIA